MPVETWFPTFVFYEDLKIDPGMRGDVLAAVRERAGPDAVTSQGFVTAANAPNDLHLDPRLSPLFDAFRPEVHRFLYDIMLFDRARVEFQVGRCWPVVQIGNGYEGTPHHHTGAAFSGVFYLQVPAGSGALEFYKPVESLYDLLPKTGWGALTYRTTVYRPVENRLLLFSGDLEHRRLPNAGSSADERIAIAFDVYTMAHIGAHGAGLPRGELLKRL